MRRNMGYVSKDIAVIREPKKVSLSALPNFVVFESKPSDKRFFEARLTIGSFDIAILPRESRIWVVDLYKNKSKITLTGIFGVKTFYGTSDPANSDNNVYHITDNSADTAENIKNVLLSDPWIASNFNIVIPFEWNDNEVTNGKTIHITSKGAGTAYNMDIQTDPSAIEVTWINKESKNNDSICGENLTAEIALDVYTDVDVFLGTDDRPITPSKIGKKVITLSKTYSGDPLWFDLNGIFTQKFDYNKPTGLPGWFDPGTLSVYRFVARVKSVNSFAFYQSNALYTLIGYGPVLDDIDLSEYVYTGGSVRLLTNRPTTPYVKGQREFLNFILQDPQRDISKPIDYFLQIAYRAYTSADTYIGIVYGQPIQRGNLNMINTCELDIDSVLDIYPTAGKIRVALARGSAIVSNDLEYEILPECLHSVRQFIFLNRLGGWDSFNFDAAKKIEVKPKVETFIKTVTPFFQRGDSVETVYSSKLNTTLTIEGAPVTDDVAEWLSELASARVILDNDGNYVIIEDFTLPITESAHNMHRPIIRYRLSDIV